MPDLKEYRVTFGVKFAREKHPRMPEAHPDGWLTIMAPNYETAREIAFDRLGDAWAFINQPHETDDWHYPRGSLDTITWKEKSE